jgi:hypothetical protein
MLSPLFMYMGAVYKERGLITSGEKDIKYGSEILELLEAVWAPKKVTVLHCPEGQDSSGIGKLESRSGSL